MDQRPLQAHPLHREYKAIPCLRAAGSVHLSIPYMQAPRPYTAHIKRKADLAVFALSAPMVLLVLDAVALLEAVYAATGIHQLLLAGIEGMAL